MLHWTELSAQQLLDFSGDLLGGWLVLSPARGKGRPRMGEQTRDAREAMAAEREAATARIRKHRAEVYAIVVESGGEIFPEND